MSKKMQKEMFRNCRDYLLGRKSRDDFWKTQIVHEEIVFGKQLPLFGGGKMKTYAFKPGTGIKTERSTVYEVYEDKAGKYRWHLRAPNGRIVADSREGYSCRANARRAIRYMRHEAPYAKVKVLR